MADAVESVLGSGEEVRLELPASGWPHLRRHAAAAYAGLVLVGLWLLADWQPITFTQGPRTLHVPMVVPWLVGFLALEVYRGARFRSSVWIITSKRLLVRRGVFWHRLRSVTPLSAVHRLDARGPEIELVTFSGRITLDGLERDALGPLAAALARAEKLGCDPASAPPRRSWRLEVAFVIATLASLALVALVHSQEERSRAAASAFVQRVLRAIAATTTTTVEKLASRPGGSGGRFEPLQAGGWGPTTLDLHVLIYESPGNPGVPTIHRQRQDSDEGTRVDIRVRGEHPYGLFPGEPWIELLPGGAPDDEVFVRELRKELASAGLSDFVRKP